MNEHPADIPEKLKKQPDLKKTKKPSTDIVMTCQN